MMNVRFHWANSIAQHAIEKFGNSQVIVAGWSPSGLFHIGNTREIITCNAFKSMFEILEIDSKLYYIIDDLDPLIKVPIVLKKHKSVLRKQLGKPLRLIPDPTGAYPSFAELFTSGLSSALSDWEIDVQVLYASEHYKQRKYDKYLSTFIQHEELLQSLLKEVTGSRMDGFITIICENCDNMNTTTMVSTEMMEYHCKDNQMFRGCGHEGSLNYKEQMWKLKWRLDQPSRQDFLNVTIEPSGKDHAVAGGSIETSTEIYKRIFEKEPPLTPGYGFITVNGKKMSGSKGWNIAATELQKFIDPFAFMFAVYVAPIKRDVEFNVKTQEYGDIIDKFTFARRSLNGKKTNDTERNQEKHKVAILLSLPKGQQSIIPVAISFSELVFLYQTNLKDYQRTIETLRILGKVQQDDSHEELQNRLKRVDYWIENFAPAIHKFSLLESPQVSSELWTNEVTKTWIDTLSGSFDKLDEFNALLRKNAKLNSVQIKHVFQAFYQLLLGKNVGPNASRLVFALGTDDVLRKIAKIDR